MTDTNEATAPATEPPGDIVATADNWYRGKMLVMGLAIMIYCGGFFIYDGFIGWPTRNAKLDQLDKQRDATTDQAEKAKLSTEIEKLGNRKSDLDINFQKVIGFVALPFGAWFLFNTFRKSRGEIRLSGQTLHAPGHPPVPFDAITKVDQRLWQKKGVAYVEYSLSEGRNGRILLDNYIYHRKPIDEIYDAIISYIVPGDTAGAESEPTGETGDSSETKNPGH